MGVSKGRKRHGIPVRKHNRLTKLVDGLPIATLFTVVVPQGPVGPSEIIVELESFFDPP